MTLLKSCQNLPGSSKAKGVPAKKPTTAIPRKTQMFSKRTRTPPSADHSQINPAGKTNAALYFDETASPIKKPAEITPARVCQPVKTTNDASAKHTIRGSGLA